jgi:hypothetical protein
MRDGILAEFESPHALLQAHDRLRALGYTRIFSWTPYPVRGVVRRLPESLVPWIMLAAALIGGGFGYLLQYWCNAVSYPIDVGGRPLHSAPAFIPITFESAVLASSLAGFFTMVAFAGLPRLHHPLSQIPGFERASIDRFWIGVDLSDARYDRSVGNDLAQLGALRCERIGAAR